MGLTEPFSGSWVDNSITKSTFALVTNLNRQENIVSMGCNTCPRSASVSLHKIERNAHPNSAHGQYNGSATANRINSHTGQTHGILMLYAYMCFFIVAMKVGEDDYIKYMGRSDFKDGKLLIAHAAAVSKASKRIQCYY